MTSSGTIIQALYMYKNDKLHQALSVNYQPQTESDRRHSERPKHRVRTDKRKGTH